MTFVVTMVGAVFLAAALTASIANEAEEPSAEEAGGNSKCYVCHATMKTEAITADHLAMDITCDQCHGPSIEHMHDEMLMTEPDLLFGRSEVRKMCSDPSCHAPGEGRIEYGLQDHKDPAKVQKFPDEWQGRTRPNGRAIMKNPVCTDCHGTHNIDKQLTTESGQKPPEWIPAFNGRDLTGWRASGEADWKIKLGRIVVTPGPKGGGDLWSKDEYENYLMAVTFRADWPIHAGIWLRARDSDHGPRVEILKNTKPMAFTGTVDLPGKGLALANLRQDLFDAGGWNTLSVEVRGPRIAVWLNGAEVGAVRCAGSEKGRIGLHVEGGPAYQDGELAVREVLIQKLPKEEAETQ